nr:hypothetical protein [Tanacetum cinerariifolium]
MTNLMRDLVKTLESASIFAKANVEGEKWEKNNPEDAAITQGEQKQDKKPEDVDANQVGGEEKASCLKGTLVIHTSEEVTHDENKSNTTKQAPSVSQVSTELTFHLTEQMSKQPTEDEAAPKKQKIFVVDPNIPTLTPLNTYFPINIRPLTVINMSLTRDYPTPLREPTPPRDKRKGKGIVAEEEPIKQILHLMEQGGSDPNTLNLQQISTYGKQMTPQEAKVQLNQLKRLADLKVAKMAECEAKRAKMIAGYNHYITFIADQQRITKINYRIDRVTRDATMRIKRDNQPLSLIVMEKFGLKQLGFSEWIEIQALASKGKGKEIDTLLKNLKAKFEWINTQAGKLGLPLPSELTTFGLSVTEKKRKRTYEILREVFVTEDIKVDRMHRNLIPPSGVVRSRGLVIKEPESRIFYLKGNF